MKNITRNNLLLSAVIPAFSFLIYFALIGEPVYGTNDDVAMNMMISGEFIVSEPTNLVLFIHPFYADIIKFLYKINIHIPWYGLSFILLSFTSLLVFNFSFIRLCNRFNNKEYILVLVLLNLFITFPILYHLQFTIISGILAISGSSFLISFYLFREEKANIRIISIIISLLLCFIGTMIRFDAAMMVFIIILPIFILLTTKNLLKFKKNNYKIFVKTGLLYVLPLLILMLGVLGIEKSKEIYYHNIEWNNYNSIRDSKIITDIVDYNAIKFNDNIIHSFGKIGWTKTDFDMIKTWQYIDSDYFESNKFNEIRNEINSNHSDEISINYKIRLKNHLVSSYQTLKDVDYLIFIFLIALILTIFKMCKKKILELSFNLIALLFISMIIYIYLACILDRTLFRTDFLILSAIVLYSFILFASIECKSRQNKLSEVKYFTSFYRLFYILTLSFTLIQFKTSFNNVKEYVKYSKSESYNLRNKILDNWSRYLPTNSIIYNVGSFFPYEYFLPLDDISIFNKLEKKSIGFIASGSSNQTPSQIKLLKKYNLEKNFFQSLAKNSNVYFVNHKNNSVLSNNIKKILCEFYLEKYEIIISFEEIKNISMLSKINFSHNIKE